MRRSGLGVLYGAVMLDMLGFGIVLPLLPFYAGDMGASPRWITAIIASFSITQLLSAPLWGRFSDRIGRRRLLIIGLFASAVSYLIFALADSMWLLLVSRATAGAAGGTLGIAQAYVADSTVGELRAKGLGSIGAASGLGIMLGPAIGGYFSRFGLGTPGFVAAGLCLVNAVAALALLPESRHFQSGRADAGRGEAATVRLWLRSCLRFPMRVLLGVYLLVIGCYTAMTSVLALYTERVFAMTAADMGIVFTVAGGVTVVVRGVLVGRLVWRFGEPATVRAGCALLALAVGCIPLVAAKWQLWVLVPAWATATGLAFPALAALISRATDEHSQGSVLGGAQMAGGAGRVLAPLAAGHLFELHSITSPFLMGAAASAVALCLAVRIRAPGVVAARK